MTDVRTEMNANPFFKPLNCPVWLRPAVFLGRMVRMRPGTVVATTAVVGALGLVEGLGLTILLPMLSVIGVTTSARPGGPARAVESAFGLLGIPIELGPVVAVFFTVSMVQIALHATQQYLIIRSGENATSMLRRFLFDAASRANWSVLAAGRGGHLINAVVSEAGRIGVIYGNTMTAFGLMFSFLVYMALAAWLSWWLTALTVLFGMTSMLALRGLYRSSRRFGVYTSAATNRMQEVLNEHIASAKLIRALGAGEWSRATFDAAAKAVGSYARRNQGNTVLVKTTVEPLGLLLIVMMIYLSVHVVKLPAAELMLLLVMIFRITPRLVVLQEMLQRISGVLPAYEAVSDTLKRLDDSREPQGRVPYAGLREAIELKGVVLRHSGHAVLHGIDLTIRARTTVALVGRSGGGKTTLLDILTGILSPDSGTVLVDGIPLRELDLTTFRRRIGIVPQESVFFHDTIAENLRIAAPEASETEIWAALAAAHADDFVRSREHGLDAVMGDQGMRLSGGQRQRLSLARALLRKPDILLLDEPTSAIDRETEAVIRDTLKRLRGQITIVMITHQRAMAEDADVVYTVAGGRVSC